MHFEDLELCRYHRGPFDPRNWRVPLLAIGWLEAQHPFTQGDAPTGLSSQIRTLNRQAIENPYVCFRGLHECSICAANESYVDRLRGSSSNLFVPGDGVVFVAPGRVDHYIDAHTYLPPVQFLDAVFDCPDLRSPDYSRALRATNAGVDPPLFGKLYSARG